MEKVTDLRPPKSITDRPTIALTLEDVDKQWRRCRRCAIGCTAYKHVFAEILPQCGVRISDSVDILMIGEGPGKSENVMGRPFIGASGELLRWVIEEADASGVDIGFDNLVACRPCNGYGQPNRAPDMDEISSCSGRLKNVIEITQPKMIMCLGSVSHAYVPNIVEETDWKGLLWHVKHPAAILRHGGKDAPYYASYVKEFAQAFEIVRKMD